MTDVPEREERTGFASDLQRHSVVSARHHVGAAGFAQTEALEQIISAGREQVALAKSIQQVVKATQNQLRDIAAGSNTNADPAQVVTLEQVVRAGVAQLEAAHTLQQIIEDTLAHVRGTPLEDISAGLLTALGGVARQQAESLEQLIAVAISEAASLKQVTVLERVIADVGERLETAERERTEREVAYLARVHQQAVGRIRELEAARQTSAEKKTQLEDENERTERHIERLEAAHVQDVAHIADLQERQQTLEKRRVQLEALAAENQERIAALTKLPTRHEARKQDTQADENTTGQAPFQAG